MNRSELEHVIRAAGEIANVRKLVIMGSQSILGQFPNLAESIYETAHTDISLLTYSREVLLRSIEVDIMVPDSEKQTELIEAAIDLRAALHPNRVLSDRDLLPYQTA